MSDKKITINPNLGGILVIIFLVLKLTKVIDWSWWWIFAPMWIPWGLFLIVLIIIAMVAGFKK